jgi:hypothetical protein
MVQILSLFLLLYFPVQQTEPRQFYIESWKCGKGRIKETSLTIELGQSIKTYKSTINGLYGYGEYELEITHNPTHDLASESWFVQLFDKGKNGHLSKSKGANLLQPYEKPGGDFFRAEDSPGWIYPTEEKNPLLRGALCLPIFARRIIRIESFYCIISVTEYKRNSQNPRLLDSIKVVIKFTNEHPWKLNDAT